MFDKKTINYIARRFFAVRGKPDAERSTEDVRPDLAQQNLRDKRKAAREQRKLVFQHGRLQPSRQTVQNGARYGKPRAIYIITQPYSFTLGGWKAEPT